MEKNKKKTKKFLFFKYRGKIPYLAFSTNIISSAVIFLILNYVVARNSSESITHNVKTGLIAAVSSFIFICIARDPFQSRVFVRPFPWLWRLIASIGLLVAMINSFILHQTRNDLRVMFSWLKTESFKLIYTNSTESPRDIINNRIKFANEIKFPVLNTTNFTSPQFTTRFLSLIPSIPEIYKCIKKHLFSSQFLWWVSKAIIYRDWTMLWFFFFFFLK
jgi:hypothetical protein